jgi:hypothetical protein
VVAGQAEITSVTALPRCAITRLMHCRNTSKIAKPVTFSLGRSRATGVGHVRKDDWDRRRFPLDGDGRRGSVCHDDVRKPRRDLSDDVRRNVGLTSDGVTMGPCRLDSPICSVALSGQAPQLRSGAPKARGLRANAGYLVGGVSRVSRI